MAQVLLINAPMQSPEAQSGFNNISPPLGLGYLASSLINNGVSVEILDLTFSKDVFTDLRKALKMQIKPFVGITGLTQNINSVFKIVEIIKKIREDSFVIIGGPHVSYRWQDALNIKEVDLVALFEAEESIIEIYNEFQNKEFTPDKIQGIAYRKNGEYVINPLRSKPLNLDLVPYPARHLLPMALYKRPGTILTSRGCPKKCIFCISSTFEGNYRMRSPDNVIGEMINMHKTFNISDFWLVDNVFTVNEDRVIEICTLIKENLPNITFNCVSRADLVTPRLISNLKEAGCIRIEIGVESGVQNNIDSLEKSITLSQVKKAADIVLEKGILPMFTFQIGSPFDTYEDMIKTCELAKWLRTKGAVTLMSIMTPYPGTPLYEMATKFKIEIKSNNWSNYRISNPVYESPFLKRNDIRKVFFHEALMDAKRKYNN